MLGGKNAVLHILHSNNFYGHSVSWPEKWALDSFQNIGKERKIAKDEGKKGGKDSKMQDLFYEQFLSMSPNPGNHNKILDVWGLKNFLIGDAHPCVERTMYPQNTAGLPLGSSQVSPQCLLLAGPDFYP